MTLITRLSTTFTDATLPILQKDPVIPDAGAVVLFDFKSVGTWPEQSSPITSYSSLVENNWPDMVPSAQHTYNSVSGRVTPSGTGAISFPVETASKRLFADLTANYCLSIWLYRPATFNPFRTSYFAGNANQFVPNTSSDHSLVIYGDNSGGINIQRPNASWSDNYLGYQAPVNAVSRIGYAWSKNNGTWQHKGILNNGTPTNWANSTFSTGANGVKDDPTWTNRLWGGFGGATSDSLQGIYRFYVENLSVSGRTPEEVWAADWARGNGRFS